MILYDLFCQQLLSKNSDTVDTLLNVSTENGFMYKLDSNSGCTVAVSLGKTGDLMNIFSQKLIFGSTGMTIEPLV